MGLLQFLPETCVEVLLCANGSDPHLKEYDGVYEHIPIEAKSLILFNSDLQSAVCNEAALLAQCEYVMVIQDGMSFDGDTTLLEATMNKAEEACRDGVFLTFPSSQYRAPIIPKRIVDLLGYYAFPAFETPVFHDKWLASIFYDLNRLFQSTLSTSTDLCRKINPDEAKMDAMVFGSTRSIRNRHLSMLVNHTETLK